MSNRPYKEVFHPVPGHRKPPADFLDQLIDTIKSLDDSVFAKNEVKDIYSVMSDFGPFDTQLQRRSVMCEVLRLIGAFESDYDWLEGADVTAGRETPPEVEAGVFQVSFNSTSFDPSLMECLKSELKLPSVSPVAFQLGMKHNHALAVEYCARLFRFNTSWSGPTNRGWTVRYAWKPAVDEFAKFLL